MKNIIALLLIFVLAGCAAQAPPQPAAETVPIAQPAAEPMAVVAPPPQQTETPAPQPAPVPEVETAPGPLTAKDPVILKQGYFHKVVHPTDGRVQIVRAPGGAMTLNLYGFDTTPGPGLTVVLHSGDVKTGYEVGTLISASGNYPYNLPNNLDVRPYTYAAIYNKKYNVIYGEAEIS